MLFRSLSWRGHRYEARYDEVPMDFGSIKLEWGNAEGARRLLVRRVYVRDICVRCGDVIKRTREVS